MVGWAPTQFIFHECCIMDSFTSYFQLISCSRLLRRRSPRLSTLPLRFMILLAMQDWFLTMVQIPCSRIWRRNGDRRQRQKRILPSVFTGAGGAGKVSPANLSAPSMPAALAPPSLMSTFAKMQLRHHPDHQNQVLTGTYLHQEGETVDGLVQSRSSQQRTRAFVCLGDRPSGPFKWTVPLRKVHCWWVICSRCNISPLHQWPACLFRCRRLMSASCVSWNSLGMRPSSRFRNPKESTISASS